VRIAIALPRAAVGNKSEQSEDEKDEAVEAV
jgi:hypothetical protein